MKLAGSRLTQDGVIVIFAQRFASQPRNREDARERVASLILAGSLVPTVLAEQRLGEEDGGLSGADRRTALLTDVALLGGLLITAADHDGRPSLAWQARRARRAIRRTTRVAEFFLPSGD